MKKLLIICMAFGLLMICSLSFGHIPVKRNVGIAVPLSKMQLAKSIKDIDPSYCKILQAPTSTVWELDRRLNRSKAYLGTGNTMVLHQQQVNRSAYLQEDFDNQAEILETTLAEKSKSGKAYVSGGSQFSIGQLAFMQRLHLGDVVEVELKFKFKDDKAGQLYSGKFLVTVVPEAEATFSGAEKGISSYVERELKKQSIPLPEMYFARIVLDVNEKGKVENVRIPEEGTDKKIGKQLLHIFKSMPDWQPARDKGNKPIKQTLELLLGERGC